MSGIFKHLTGRAQVRRPSEGGSLFVREYHGRQTLVDQAGRPICAGQDQRTLIDETFRYQRI
ncbi:MAG: hypothetical protein PHP94_09705, partial [Eubacteriales bacterium]|nr:hypothetical protein [Eubacteriales bacterium]